MPTRPCAFPARRWGLPLFGLLGVAGLTGCYASHPPITDDPFDAGTDAEAPSDARVDDACECPCMDPERACPAGLVASVPPLEGPSGVTLHWPRDRGCVAIFYEPALEPLRDQIEWAVSSWLDLPCSSLCFLAPVPAPAENRFCAHAVHFVEDGFENERWGSCSSVGTASTLSTTVTGALQHACVQVAEAPRPRELLASVGYALGFRQPPLDTPVDSVLSGRAEDRDRDELGADDVASFCAFYGETPYCPY